MDEHESQVASIEEMRRLDRKRRISDIGWEGWTVLLAILVPVAAGAYFAGSAMSSVDRLSESIDHRFETLDANLALRDAKLDLMMDHIRTDAQFTPRDWKRLEESIERVERKVDIHASNAGPLIQKLELLWARAGLDKIPDHYNHSEQ